VNAATDLIPFYPYYVLKDLVGMMLLLGVGTLLVFYYPDLLSHPDNFVPANPYATPAHIVPEWYFLWVYAILRSIPSKLAGVASIGLVFVCLALLPFLHTAPLRSPRFRLLHEWFFWTFVADCLLLSWLGALPVEQPYVIAGQLCAVWFFVYLTVIVPFIGFLENSLLLRAKQMN
jgi:quinol-cytochrome oxidoreductase complex cytochrome b subunit